MTADARIVDALARLAELDSLPLGEQVAVFTDIHDRLADILASGPVEKLLARWLGLSLKSGQSLQSPRSPDDQTSPGR